MLYISPTPEALAQISLVLLAAVPLVGGLGLSLSRRFTNNLAKTLTTTLCALALALNAALVVSYLLPRFDANGTGLYLRVGLTFIFWLVIGHMTGSATALFASIVGVKNCICTMAIDVAAFSSSAIVFDTVFSPELSESSLVVYGALLGLCVITLLILQHSWRAWGIAVIFKRLLANFTVLGVLLLGINWVTESMLPLGQRLWWIPETVAPSAYGALVAMAWTGLIKRAVEEPVFGFVPPLDPKTRWLIYLNAVGALGDLPDPELAATRSSFRYDIPSRFTKYYVRQGPGTDTTATLRPKSLLDRMGRGHMYLFIAQYPRDFPHTEEALRRTTYVNLLGEGFGIASDQIGRRHGVMSHEVKYKKAQQYGYLIRFVKFDFEVTAIWMTFGPLLFRKYLPDLEELVDSVRVRALTKKEAG